MTTHPEECTRESVRQLVICLHQANAAGLSRFVCSVHGYELHRPGTRRTPRAEKPELYQLREQEAYPPTGLLECLLHSAITGNNLLCRLGSACLVSHALHRASAFLASLTSYITMIRNRRKSRGGSGRPGSVGRCAGDHRPMAWSFGAAQPTIDQAKGLLQNSVSRLKSTISAPSAQIDTIPKSWLHRISGETGYATADFNCRLPCPVRLRKSELNQSRSDPRPGTEEDPVAARAESQFNPKTARCMASASPHHEVVAWDGPQTSTELFCLGDPGLPRYQQKQRRRTCIVLYLWTDHMLYYIYCISEQPHID